MNIKDFYKLCPEGVKIALWVIPGSAQNAIVEPLEDADGTVYLKVKITATAEDGKANKALIRFLAKRWGVAPSSCELLYGHSSRKKRVLVRGDGVALVERLKKEVD